MADKTQTALPDATYPLDGAEKVYGVQGGNSREFLLSEVGKVPLATVNTFTKTQIGEVLALTHNTAWDARESQNLTVDVNGSNFTIANPTNLQAGAYYAITVTYTTTHTLAWGNLFRGVAALSLSATAGMADHIVFRCDGTNLDCVGFRADVEAV